MWASWAQEPTCTHCIMVTTEMVPSRSSCKPDCLFRVTQHCNKCLLHPRGWTGCLMPLTN